MVLSIHSEVESMTRDSIFKQFKANADSQISSFSHQIEEHLIQAHETANALSLFHSFNETILSRDTFSALVSFKALDPAVQVLEWVPHVNHADVSTFINSTQNEFPNFNLFDLGFEDGIFSNRSIYYPVLYAEPVAGNEAVVGLILNSDETVSEALENW